MKSATAMRGCTCSGTVGSANCELQVMSAAMIAAEFANHLSGHNLTIPAASH